MTPQVLHEAEIETVEAALRYDREQAGLEAQILAAVDEAIAAIAEHPERYAYCEPLLPEKRFRRLAVERVPYVVIYEDRGEHLLIVAISHTARRADYWRERLP